MPAATVAVVSISPKGLAACLDSLRNQVGAPPFEVVVAAAGPPDAAPGDPEVVRVSAGPSPPLLAAAALRAARGPVVLLTEDHCRPDPGWVAALVRALEADPGPIGAAGGPVAPAAGMDALGWAFHFSDFAPYVPPAVPGPARSLSVCNVAYRRSALERVADAWRADFHETRVHRALRRRVGPLVLVPEAVVRTGRRPALMDALGERFAFGRVHAAGLLDGAPVAARAARTVASAVVPAVLLARQARRAAATGHGSRWIRSLPHLAALALAWSAGEALGAATGRPPREARAAADAE